MSALAPSMSPNHLISKPSEHEHNGCKNENIKVDIEISIYGYINKISILTNILVNQYICIMEREREKQPNFIDK